MAGEDAAAPSVFRDRSISYVELPTKDIQEMAAFYQAVFRWSLDPDSPGSFADGSGHVIGHFVGDLAVAGDAGPRPYIYTDDIDATVTRVEEAGGTIVREKYAEGRSLWVSLFKDPTGNVLGVWQRIPDEQRER